MRHRSACVARFGSGLNEFVQLLIRSRSSSGRFIRSLDPTYTHEHTHVAYPYAYPVHSLLVVIFVVMARYIVSNIAILTAYRIVLNIAIVPAQTIRYFALPY